MLLNISIAHWSVNGGFFFIKNNRVHLLFCFLSPGLSGALLGRPHEAALGIRAACGAGFPRPSASGNRACVAWEGEKRQRKQTSAHPQHLLGQLLEGKPFLEAGMG